MDRYCKKSVQKNPHEFTKLGRAVCVLGRTGIGKTWTVHRELDPCIEITADILKSKQETTELLAKIKGTNIPVILDEYECVVGLIGLKEITEIPTDGLFVVISQIPVKFNFEIINYEFPIPTNDEIKKIVPRATPEVLEAAAGDIRWVKQATEFKTDFKDDFQGPREFVTSLVSRTSRTNPAVYAGASLAEPGNMASILNANYLDSQSVPFAEVADMFSVADMIEDVVYSGEWELMPYFNFWGCILPAVTIGHTLGNHLKPGSSWTKYQNMCMRRKKIRAMYERVPRMTQDIDGIFLILDYIQKDEERAVELMKEYGFQKEDIDILNHLSPTRKLKAKAISNLKKSIAQ